MGVTSTFKLKWFSGRLHAARCAMHACASVVICSIICALLQSSSGRLSTLERPSQGSRSCRILLSLVLIVLSCGRGFVCSPSRHSSEHRQVVYAQDIALLRLLISPLLPNCPDARHTHSHDPCRRSAPPIPMTQHGHVAWRMYLVAFLTTCTYSPCMPR